MRVVGRKQLEDFAHLHADIRPQLDAWLKELEEADWRETQKVRDRYTNASFLSGNRVVFNLKGNKYRLLTKMSFEVQVVFVVRIGTHAEYSKWEL
jgi:mRNA interferase HigB